MTSKMTESTTFHAALQKHKLSKDQLKNPYLWPMAALAAPSALHSVVSFSNLTVDGSVLMALGADMLIARLLSRFELQVPGGSSRVAREREIRPTTRQIPIRLSGLLPSYSFHFFFFFSSFVSIRGKHDNRFACIDLLLLTRACTRTN